MQVIMADPNQKGSSVLHPAVCGNPGGRSADGRRLSDTRLWDGGGNGRRILADRALDGSGDRTRSVKVNLGESPLGWLAARGRITNRQLDAGEQLRRDWTVANLGPRTTMRWDASPASGRRGPGGAMDPSRARMQPQGRYARSEEPRPKPPPL